MSMNKVIFKTPEGETLTVDHVPVILAESIVDSLEKGTLKVEVWQKKETLLRSTKDK